MIFCLVVVALASPVWSETYAECGKPCDEQWLYSATADEMRGELENGLNINGKYSQGHTLLQLATNVSNIEVMELLIRLGSDVKVISEQETNISGAGENLLHLASWHSSALNLLLKSGADSLINSPDEYGVTPFFKALTEKDLLILDEQITAELMGVVTNYFTFNPDGTAEDLVNNQDFQHFLTINPAAARVIVREVQNKIESDEEDYVPQNIKEKRTEAEKVKSLEAVGHFEIGQYGAYPEREVPLKGLEHIEIMLKFGADRNAVDLRTGGNALHRASHMGSAEIIHFLLGAGVDAKAKDNEGKTPWDYAKDNDEFKDDIAGIKTECFESWNCSYETVVMNMLRKASKSGKLAFEEWWEKKLNMIDVKAELDSGASLMTKEYGFKGRPFHLASQYGTPEVLKVILDTDADVMVRTEHSLTPLHYAARSKNSGNIKVLVDAGANVNATDIYGETPLNVAASFGSLENIQNLLAAGADINISGPGSATPLHSAAGCYWADYCEQGKISLLLSAGLDASVKDNEGKTAWDIVQGYDDYQKDNISDLDYNALKVATCGEGNWFKNLIGWCG